MGSLHTSSEGPTTSTSVAIRSPSPIAYSTEDTAANDICENLRNELFLFGKGVAWKAPVVYRLKARQSEMLY